MPTRAVKRIPLYSEDDAIAENLSELLNVGHIPERIVYKRDNHQLHNLL